LPSISANVSARAPTPTVSAFRIIHAIPGRVRIVFERSADDHGFRLARRLALHQAVRAMRWSPAARSLTVEFAAGRCFEEILGDLPEDLPHSAPIVIREPVATRPLGLLSLALDLLSGRAPIGFILELVTSYRRVRLA
jgi:hypothetical protein